MTDLQIHFVPADSLVMYDGNAKEHPYWQIDQIASSIEQFGNCDPIAVWTNPRGQYEIVEGHGRLMALRQLGIEKVPIIFLDHLSDEQRRAYALVHNQLTMNTDFDIPVLEDEISKIQDIDMTQYDFTTESPVDLSKFDTDVRNDGKEPVDDGDEPIKGTIVCECCGELIYL